VSARLLRFDEWTEPVPPVRREVLRALPDDDGGRPPLLFVPGYFHGAWAFAEHWLGRAAARGYPAYAVSLRGQGGSGAGAASLRAYAHDVVQVAASLPRRAVLLGHGAGALVVTRAMARYPARAAVLMAPVLDGAAAAWTALRANPLGTLPAAFGGRLRLGRWQLFGPDVAADRADGHLARLSPVGARAQWELLWHRDAEPAVGSPPVLVAGSPDDRVVSRAALDRAASRFGGAPLLFPGAGHDLMLEDGWAEPIDAVLDWLDKQVTS
jgi:pimeloyl-ACP methyl ester carboxylesterase